MEKENVDECDDNRGEDDGVKPIEPHIAFITFLIILLPEQPFHFLGDMEVKDDYKAEDPPPVSKPRHPQRVKYGPETHSEPFVVV